MRRDGCIRLIQIGVDIGVAGEGVCFRAVGEIVDELRADDVHEFERGLATAGLGLSLSLSRRLCLGGRSGRC